MGSHGGNRLIARFCDYTTGIGAPMVRSGRRGTVSILLILVPDHYRHLPRVGWVSFACLRSGPSPSDGGRGIWEQGGLSRIRNSSSEPGAHAHRPVDVEAGLPPLSWPWVRAHARALRPLRGFIASTIGQADDKGLHPVPLRPEAHSPRLVLGIPLCHFDGAPPLIFITLHTCGLCTGMESV